MHGGAALRREQQREIMGGTAEDVPVLPYSATAPTGRRSVRSGSTRQLPNHRFPGGA